MKEWQRAKTTRVYLQPPKAERLITLWREGKVMLGEIETPINQPYENLTASGIWFLDGSGNQASFKDSHYELREDGIPVHKLVFELGELCAILECVCDFSRCPSAHIKLTVSSKNGAPVSSKVGFVIRCGKEAELIFSSPDVYAIYEPNVDAWLDMPSSWSFDGAWHSGDYFLACDKACRFSFNEKRGTAFAEINLAANESESFYFTLGKGEYIPADYEKIKSEAVSLWLGELSRINKLPERILSDAQRLREIKNLTVQMLQCFCYGVSAKNLYSRQGGLQRRVWTYEAMPVLDALRRIGSFDDYIEPVIDVYFNEFYNESGEIVPLGIHWAMATGTILSSFAKYAAYRGKDYYLKYRDKAMHSFEWMKETRGKKNYDGAVAQSDEHSLKENYLCVDGLFPPMACCDSPLIFQAWLSTDCNNIMGLGAFAETAELFNDARAHEVRAEYEAYKKVLSDAWENLKAKAGDTDELKVPYTPVGDNDEVTKRYSFSPSIGFIMDALNMEPVDYERVINY